MDEPTVGIDPQSRNHILESVLKLRDEGATIIYTSHYMQEVDDICDRISIVDKGHIIAEGTSEELKNLVSSKSIYDLKLNKKIEGLEDCFKEIAGIEKVSNNNEEYKISSLKSKNVLTEIVETVIKNGGEIRSISDNEPSLEAVFLALTGKNLRD
ncbi:DUF4162 domain-containing protein [Clostridium sp. DSM 8431]|uniref:ATP-binding protein DrrA1-3 family domain-containing protein n=1 Tax=Clostridium sp. DSM 8431 TaxID=1761781 RepID=UPI001FA901A8|nr:DUF4162 domain-containing protein [Clostridium sp. DSM 8431]